MIEELEDRLPEETRFRDEGCDLFPSCLNCPLPRCRYDLDGEGRAINELRNEAIVQLKAEGKSTKQIAELFGLSQRTVQRIIAKGRGNS